MLLSGFNIPPEFNVKLDGGEKVKSPVNATFPEFPITNVNGENALDPDMLVVESNLNVRILTDPLLTKDGPLIINVEFVVWKIDPLLITLPFA